ncbi:hypothetical protein PHYC_01885 [Phycisphaerales bacterium]|nr:hypothetical protein PHYC_01885 [Phycisphaerales bacterium]
MREGAARLAAGLGALALLWIVIYWWWPSAEPPVTFAQPDAAEPVSLPPPQSEVKPPPAPAVQPDPAPPPIAVIPPDFFDHTVAEGETLASISKKYFGTEAHAQAISRANPLANLNPLKTGRTIRIPRDPQNIQGVVFGPDPEPPTDGAREYVVKKGDSLSRIAADLYGDSSLSNFIYLANKDQMPDEHSVRIGQRLRIPPKPR